MFHNLHVIGERSNFSVIFAVLRYLAWQHVVGWLKCSEIYIEAWCWAWPKCTADAACRQLHSTECKTKRSIGCLLISIARYVYLSNVDWEIRSACGDVWWNLQKGTKQGRNNATMVLYTMIDLELSWYSWQILLLQCFDHTLVIFFRQLENDGIHKGVLYFIPYILCIIRTLLQWSRRICNNGTAATKEMRHIRIVSNQDCMWCDGYPHLVITFVKMNTLVAYCMSCLHTSGSYYLLYSYK